MGKRESIRASSNVRAAPSPLAASASMRSGTSGKLWRQMLLHPRNRESGEQLMICLRNHGITRRVLARLGTDATCSRHYVSHMAAAEPTAGTGHSSQPLVESNGRFQNPWDTWQDRGLGDVLAWQWNKRQSDLPKGPWLRESGNPTSADYKAAFPLHQLDVDMIGTPPGVTHAFSLLSSALP